MLDYRLVNDSGYGYAVLCRGVKVFHAFNMDKIHAWFKAQGITNYQVG